jgi:hypothetical protein
VRTAVVRVVVDVDGSMDEVVYETGIAALRAAGVEVVASPFAHLPDTHREVEVIAADLDVRDPEDYARLCSTWFGSPCTPGVTTYVSRGTDEDVHGVLAAFGLSAPVERTEHGDDEIVTVTVTADDLRKVPESRLLTALEAALNCEVRIVVS